jgi:hypothetical protein
MHTTPARTKAKEKRKQAQAWRQEIRTIEELVTIPSKAKEAMTRAREEEEARLNREAMGLQERARLEDIGVWQMEKVKGGKPYKYWMASWREGGRVRNVHLGSCRKVSKEEALQKAREAKAKALGVAYEANM